MNFQVEKDGKIYAPCPGCGQRVELKELPDGEAMCGGCKSTFPYRVPPGVGPQQIKENLPCHTVDISGKEIPSSPSLPKGETGGFTTGKKPRDKWNEEHDKLLTDAYARGGISEAVRIFQGRFSRSYIYKRLHHLDIQINKKSRRWSEADISILRALYPIYGSLKVKKDLNNRFSRQAILWKAHSLNIVYQLRALWTEDDERILRKTYPESGCRGASKALKGKFTKGAIVHRACRLGIKSNRQNKIARSKSKKADFIIKARPGQKIVLHIKIVPEVA